ncbi:MAG: ABC transporter ATP-binding protein, partial [Lachnospirales bacterium]
MIIRAKGITKKYRDYELKNITLEVSKGDIVGIIGKNGSGKTTLLSIMAGIKKADKGELFYEDCDVFKNKNFSSYVGYLPQENPLIDELSVKDNLSLWCKKGHSKDIINNLGIYEFLNKRVDKLSGGMKRRVSLGIALSKNPKILLLDEPSAALDIYGKEEILGIIKSFVKNGGTVIMSTHD